MPAVALQLANGIIAKTANVLLGPTYLASCPRSRPRSARTAGRSRTVSRRRCSRCRRLSVFRRLVEQRSGDRADALHRRQRLEMRGADFHDGCDRSRYRAFRVIRASPRRWRRSKHSIPDVILDATVGTSTRTVLRGIKDDGLDTVPVMSSLGNVFTHKWMSTPRSFRALSRRREPVRDAQQLFYKSFNAQRRSGRRQQPIAGLHVRLNRDLPLESAQENVGSRKRTRRQTA